MKKIMFILALAMLYNSNAGAKDRDCVRYTAEEAKEAIGESESTSFSAVFSHAAGRIGNTNTGCLASDSPYVRDDLPTPTAKYGYRLLMFDMSGYDFSGIPDVYAPVPQDQWDTLPAELNPNNYSDEYSSYKYYCNWSPMLIPPEVCCIAGLGSNCFGEGSVMSWYKVNPDGDDIELATDSMYYNLPNGDRLPEGSYYVLITDKNNNQYRSQMMEVPAPQE